MSSLLSRTLRPLRGANLEIVKFGMYLMFPIGWMYYFGTNLEDRFTVPEFWPTQAQSHKIPFEKEEIRAEVERIQRNLKAQKAERDEDRKRQTEGLLRQASDVFRKADGDVGVVER